MADYDWDPPTYTAKEREQHKLAEIAKKQREKDSFQCALAEARRMLMSGESALYHATEFVNEIHHRMKIREGDSARRAWLYLEDHREIEKGFGYKKGPGPNLKEPDPEYLSDYEPYFVPVEATPNKTARLSATRRALTTQKYIHEQLNQGATFLIRRPNGETEELQFTQEWLDE